MKNADRRPLPVRIFRFYYDGFREMTLGRTLWAIILIKLFILFVVLRLLFFPDVLGGKSAEERGEIVRNELIKHQIPLEDGINRPKILLNITTAIP